MLLRKRKLRIEGERIYLRLPEMSDHHPWVELRQASAEFLRPWEPDWARNHFSRKAFQNRVHWARKTFDARDGLPMFVMRKSDDALLGGITLDNVRRGPAQAATLGYWIGEEYARHGYMSEAIKACVNYGFAKLDLSRVEAATLPENAPSRGVLEKSGFKYEGVAQAYLQINGRWRTHVLYANLRHDRLGRTDVG